jgi:hypothetical protein
MAKSSQINFEFCTCDFSENLEDPILIAQGDTQNTTEATHSENVHLHTSTTQHQAKQDTSSHQPKAAHDAQLTFLRFPGS